jgi:pyruvate formate lyase activating enzyme
MSPQTASYWDKADKGGVRCCLCPKNCIIKEGGTGFCKVRRNKEGQLVAENYGQITSLCIDPIEKKPLYHFHPGSQILSIGTYGCNFTCEFCQNWRISQERPPTQSLDPDALADMSTRQGSIGVAFTYNEPSIWFEYVRDCAVKVKEQGGKVVLVTNGYINREPLEELLQYADAFNVDLKSMDPKFYAKLCQGKPEPVTESIRTIAQHPHAHIEVTCLLVPHYRDIIEDMKKVREFILSVDPEIPVHLSRYFPQYRSDVPPTSEALMREVYDLMRAQLPFVYTGNIHLPDASDTYCPNCGEKVIQRSGYAIDTSNLDGNACSGCGHKLPIAI